MFNKTNDEGYRRGIVDFYIQHEDGSAELVKDCCNKIYFVQKRIPDHENSNEMVSALRQSSFSMLVLQTLLFAAFNSEQPSLEQRMTERQPFH